MHFPPLLRAARRFAASRPEARRFAARAWIGAPVVRASLAVGGLRPTLRWIEAISGRATVRRAFPVDVTEGSSLVGGAFRAHVVGGECLPRSLVQYLLHRLDGQPVRFVMGVKRVGADALTAGGPAIHDGGDPHPPASAIAAHAWVEAGEAAVDGAPAFAPLFATGALGEP